MALGGCVSITTTRNDPLHDILMELLKSVYTCMCCVLNLSLCIRASVDALYRDGANVRGDAHMRKSFHAPRMCEHEPS